MSTEEILNFINDSRQAGLDDESIKTTLNQSGWDSKLINTAFILANNKLQVPTPPKDGTTQQPNGPSQSPDQSEKGSLWDTFEHILLFISLFALYICTGLLLNIFVNRWFPVQPLLENYRFYDTWEIKMYLSGIIVSFPFFSFFFLKIYKRTLTHPATKNLRARKALIYFTLVVTFVVMLANLVRTVFTLLDGNLSPNFIGHFAVNMGTSALIFAYYLNEVKEDRKKYA